MLSSCPLASLLFGGNHILVILAQICITNCFFSGLQMQSCPCPGRGNNPLPDPSPRLGSFALSHFSSQITFGDMEKYVISTGALSLIIMMNVSKTACLKLDVILCPLAIWSKSYSSHLCPKYASEIICIIFSGSKCKNFPALGGGHPLIYRPDPRSSPRRLLSETWKYR